MNTISTSVPDRPLIGFFKRTRRRRGSGQSPIASRIEPAVVEPDRLQRTPSRKDGVPAQIPSVKEELLSTVRNLRGAEVEAFFRSHLSNGCERASLVETIHREDVEILSADRQAIGALKGINSARWINKYFRAVNSRLDTGGLFLGCAEVNGQRRARLFRKYPAFLAYPICAVDFLMHRFCPKVPYLKAAYFAITKGRNRPVARSEALGRLISCGFQIAEYREIGGLMYFAVHKVKESETASDPTYGLFCKLKRIGIGGEIFTVFKFRTMHPYAEFLQEYLYDKHNLQAGGKFLDDFRVTAWGRWMRRFWLDEIPMFLNLLKGDLKLVGVRPLSQQYFGLYPDELKDMRTRHLPGLIPPFYVDMPETFDEIVQSEMKYLLEYEKAPFRTDVKYLFLALWNILIRRARSA